MDTLALNYPDFTLATYREVLVRLAARFRIRCVRDALEESYAAGTLLLRHDVDFSPDLALPLAEIEAELGLRSTYFVALHLQYNTHAPRQARVLQRIGALGHEIGLHYDSAVYDDAGSHEVQLVRLQQHVRVLQEICQSPVVSIARHNPSIASGHDPFAAGTPYHNAYDPCLFNDSIYLSDSCRAWREGGLRPCWSEPPPRRIYLLIHPELWSEVSGVERLAYLELLRQRAQDDCNLLYRSVQEVWQSHAGGQEHDRRGRLDECPKL